MNATAVSVNEHAHTAKKNRVCSFTQAAREIAVPGKANGSIGLQGTRRHSQSVKTVAPAAGGGGDDDGGEGSAINRATTQ